MAENLMKVPVKGILKNSTSFEGVTSSNKCSSSTGRGTKWDEMNILATHHPPDKDYGHMKIEEPKTPFSYQGEDSGDEGEAPNLDSNLLAEKLLVDTEHTKFRNQESLASDDEEDEDEDESPEDKAKRRLFENKRKAHYNEFMAVKLARQLMEKEADNEEESEEATEKTTDADEVDLEEVDNTSDTINNVPIDDKSSHVNSDSLDDMDTKDSDSVGVVQDSSVDIV